MEDDDDATEIIPAHSGGNGKTAMPSVRKPFGSFAFCFLAIFVLTVTALCVMSWCNQHIRYRVQWIGEILTIGKKKADMNLWNHYQNDLDNHTNWDFPAGFE